MGNNSRWKQLMEWLAYMEDTQREITVKDIKDKIYEIKRGSNYGKEDK